MIAIAEATIQNVNLPATYIDGPYCIVFELGDYFIWGAETYSKERAQNLANHRIVHSKGQNMTFGVELKANFPEIEPR